MMWAVAALLVMTMIGLPLSVALTGTTVALAGVAGLLALVGLLTSVPALLTVAVAVGLVEALVAILLAGTPPDFWLALLFGIVIYLFLDVGAFMANFRGVAVDASVYRMKAIYWGWTALLSGLAGLVVGLLAAAFAHPWTPPLPLYLLAVVSACVAIGVVVGAVSLWQH